MFHVQTQMFDFLFEKFDPLHDEEILSASPTHMKITASSFMRELKRADQTKQVFLFAHSHPNGPEHHSEQDDIEEKKLFATAYIRIDNPGPHGSLVMSADGSIKGRVWMRSGECLQIETIRIIGKRFRFHQTMKRHLMSVFSAASLAFGNPLQSVLKNIHVGLLGSVVPAQASWSNLFAWGGEDYCFRWRSS